MRKREEKWRGNGQKEERIFVQKLVQNSSCKLIQLVNKLVGKQLIEKRRIWKNVFGLKEMSFWAEESE